MSHSQQPHFGEMAKVGIVTNKFTFIALKVRPTFFYLYPLQFNMLYLRLTCIHLTNNISIGKIYWSRNIIISVLKWFLWPGCHTLHSHTQQLGNSPARFPCRPRLGLRPHSPAPPHPPNFRLIYSHWFFPHISRA